MPLPAGRSRGPASTAQSRVLYSAVHLRRWRNW